MVASLVANRGGPRGIGGDTSNHSIQQLTDSAQPPPDFESLSLRQFIPRGALAMVASRRRKISGEFRRKCRRYFGELYSESPVRRVLERP